MVIYAMVVAAGLATDLVSKQWVFARLGMPGQGAPTIGIAGRYLEWQTSLNEGALFGLGGGLQAVFAGLSLVAACVVVWWLFWAGNARDLPLTVALGGVTAGILGNLFDRLGLHGLRWPDGGRVHAVRDWVHFQIPGVLDWPNFNFADSFLFCGACLLVWRAYRPEPVASESSASVPNSMPLP